MSRLFAYMAGREGDGGLKVLKCFVRGGQNFSTCFVCVCVCVGGGQAQYLSFREKNNRPPPIINDRSL